MEDLALPTSTSGETKTETEIAAAYFGELDSRCEKSLKESLSEPYLMQIAEAHRFAPELALWRDLIGGKRESELFEVAEREYEYAMLALIQGQYRHSFKSLRLVLELTLQAVYLSGNEVKLREWLSNRMDTSWAAIIDKQEGIFSERFCKAFFPPLKDRVSHYGGMAVLLYRECSECVHGKTPELIPLPDPIAFDIKTFELWHSKAVILRLVTHFALALRYFNDLVPEKQRRLGPCLNHLSHIPEIKTAISPSA